MAIIGRIRRYSGLLVIIVGIALAAFVLGDFLKKGPRQRSKLFAEIAGEKISYQEFEQKVEEQIERIKEQSGEENIPSNQIYQLREKVWSQMVKDIIMGKEFEELGITVSPLELEDLAWGKNPHPYIIQSFTDPKTGQFNADAVKNFISRFDELDAKQKEQWLDLEKAVKTERINTKYYNLIRNAYYIPKAFAKKDYEARKRTAYFRFFTVGYNTISDSTITVTQQDLVKYYEEYKYKFYQEDSRDIDYVIFEVLPSVDDYNKAKEEIYQIKTELQTTDDIVNFVNANSDVRYDSTFLKKEELPLQLDSIMYDSIGTIVGPYMENNTYYLAKLVDIQQRPDSMKAQHILIAYKGAFRVNEKNTRTKEQAKKMADSLLVVVKQFPDQFQQIAKNISDDQSAKENGGDLKWFKDGMMVKPFNDACLKGKVGDKVIAETDFGFHVIDITGKPDAIQKVRVAVVKRLINPSTETYQDVYSKASLFAGASPTKEAFDKNVIDKGINKRIAEHVRPMDNNIPGIEAPRELIRWAFNEETKKNDVSKIFDTEGKYVIAVLKEIREKGIAPLEQIKPEIQNIAKREKKADIIMNKISALMKVTKDINQLAMQYKISVDTLDYMTFATSFLPGYGPEMKVIGTLFTLKKGVLSQPVKGETGVFVMMVDNFVEPTPVLNYDEDIRMMTDYFKQRVSYDAYNSLEKAAEITDNRGLFY